MEQSYEIPTASHSTKKERNIFWDRIIAEQKASGISAPRFCQQHQIPFTMFRNRQYRFRQMEKQKACDKQTKDTNSGVANRNGFVPIQITEELPHAPLLPQDEHYIDIKVTFKNGHVIEITLPSKQEYFMVMIDKVSKLPC